MLPSTTMSATVNGNHFPALAQRPVERQVVQHIVAIDVARVRFPADAFLSNRYHHLECALQAAASVRICRSKNSQLNGCRFEAVTVKAHFLLGWALPFSLT